MSLGIAEIAIHQGVPTLKVKTLEKKFHLFRIDDL